MNIRKEIYESVMHSVSSQLKKYLNEDFEDFRESEPMFRIYVNGKEHGNGYASFEEAKEVADNIWCENCEICIFNQSNGKLVYRQTIK